MGTEWFLIGLLSGIFIGGVIGAIVGIKAVSKLLSAFKEAIESERRVWEEVRK